MKAAALPRWAISFADLALLLLCFFALLHAGDARKVAAGARAAFSYESLPGPLLNERAASLFEAHEARLLPAAHARLVGIGARAARAGGSLSVESDGRDPAAHRFDAWELAAARAAALARALNEGGLAEDRIDIVLPRRTRNEAIREQSLLVRHVG